MAKDQDQRSEPDLWRPGGPSVALSAVGMCLAFQNPRSGSSFQEDHRQGRTRDDAGSLGIVIDAEYLFLVLQMVGPGAKERSCRCWSKTSQSPMPIYIPLWVAAPGS